MTSFVNLTPHEIKILNADTDLVDSFPPSGIVARVSVTVIEGEKIGSYRTVQSVYGEVENLPSEQPDVFYIVSQMVLGKTKDRLDVLAPDSGLTAVRNEAGQIAYVLDFVRPN